jgi:tRNA(Ile)-lysidine synthase
MLGVPGVTPLPEVGLVLHARLLDAVGHDVPRDRRVVVFDADQLPSPLAVRARRRGDRFTPLGGPERRLKSFLIGAKVPRWERDTIPIVEAAGRVVWVAGLRRGDAAPVTAVTRQVLELALVSLAETPATR